LHLASLHATLDFRHLQQPAIAVQLHGQLAIAAFLDVLNEAADITRVEIAIRIGSGHLPARLRLAQAWGKGGQAGGAGEKIATMKLHGFLPSSARPRPARLSKRVIAHRIHARLRQKMPNCHYLIFGKAVLGIVEGMGVATQLHGQVAGPVMGHLGTEFLKHCLYSLGVNIGADGVGEDRVQYLAMTMVHDGPAFRMGL
jgi:hypothetical protein